MPPYLYPFKLHSKHNIGAHMSSLTRPTSPKETPNTHSIMLNWGLFPRLTTKFVPQGIDTIKTSHKGVNTSPIGIQQHTMIIYIIISSQVTNTSTKNIIILGESFPEGSSARTKRCCFWRIAPCNKTP